MTIEWLKDGDLVKLANRIRYNQGFGLATLAISPVYSDDNGIYTCRARNRFGEAQVEATLDCFTGDKILLNTMHVNALDKLSEIEGTKVIRINLKFSFYFKIIFSSC